APAEVSLAAASQRMAANRACSPAPVLARHRWAPVRPPIVGTGSPAASGQALPVCLPAAGMAGVAMRARLARRTLTPTSTWPVLKLAAMAALILPAPAAVRRAEPMTRRPTWQRMAGRGRPRVQKAARLVRRPAALTEQVQKGWLPVAVPVVMQDGRDR